MKSQRAAITLNKVRLWDFSVTPPRRECVPIFDHETSGSIYGPMGDDFVYLTFRLLLDGPHKHSDYHELMAIFVHQSLFTLGSGDSCPFCGLYAMPGLVKCVRCGGVIERVPFMKPVELPFRLLCIRDMSNQIRPLPHKDGPMWATVELAAYNPDAWFEALAGSMTIEGIQHSTGLTGYYLCGWCGSSAEVGSKCGRCSGDQIPFSEIVKMDRECIYCGCETLGDVVCWGCGNQVAGLTYAMAREVR